MNEIKKSLRDSAVMRWFVLLLISGIIFGTYWFYDFFSPLKDLMIKELGISNADYGMIMAATTVANMFGIIMLGGLFLDRFGIRKSIILFGGLTTVGALVVALAAAGTFGSSASAKVWAMSAGRLLFGSGLEIVIVVLNRTIVKWFKGKELALAMAINVGIGRFGTFMAISFSLGLSAVSISPAVNLAAGLVGVGFLMLLAYMVFDVRIDGQVQPEAEEEEPFRLADLKALVTNPAFIYITLLCVAFYSAVFPFIQYAPDLLINKFGFTSSMPDLAGKSFWDSAKAYLTNGPKVAGFIPLGTIIFTPIFGAYVDKKGKAASIMIVGGLLLIFAHLSLSLSNSVTLGYAGLFALGIAFSLVPSAMWPSVAKIVPERRLGSAYASMATIQNWGLFAFFWGIGQALDMTNSDPGRFLVATFNKASTAIYPSGEQLGVSLQVGLVTATDENHALLKAAADAFASCKFVLDYTTPILTLVGCGVVSIVLAFLLKAADRKAGYGLELPSAVTPPGGSD